MYLMFFYFLDCKMYGASHFDTSKVGTDLIHCFAVIAAGHVVVFLWLSLSQEILTLSSLLLIFKYFSYTTIEFNCHLCCLLKDCPVIQHRGRSHYTYGNVRKWTAEEEIWFQWGKCLSFQEWWQPHNFLQNIHLFYRI